MRAHTFDMVYMYDCRLAHQVKSVLAKVELCRTKALGGHVYRCSSCRYELPVYNSCRDRHCPQCSGGQRAKWLDKLSELFLPQIDYFQIVFTLPSQLTSFALGNRRELFDLLLRAAWQGLDAVLRETLGVAPAATLVLHTWNQELDVHPHVHALVPGSFPTLDGKRWITPKHPQHKRRRQAYLCSVVDLGGAFRKKFLIGLRRLYKQGQLKFEHEPQAEPAAFAAWLAELEAIDWNVYIQGPPRKGADPTQVAKYLARYMTGGPISDSRIISHDGQEVWFQARSRDKRNESRPFRLGGRQFVLRWSQHILPKGFTKCRSYGGYHNTKRAEYLALCHQLLPVKAADEPPPELTPPPEATATEQLPRLCPHCQAEMSCSGQSNRSSWQDVLGGRYRPTWYYGFLPGHAAAMEWYRNGY